MEVSTREKEYLDMLKKRFEKQNFCMFIKDLLNLTNENITHTGTNRPTSEQYKNYIDTVELYAKYRDTYENDIGIILIKLQDGKNPSNARTLQRNYIAHMMDYYNLTATIAVFYSNTDDYWRLSFVKQETKIEVGKVKTEVSPAKRYSYLFGENEPNHTAQTQLLMLLQNNEKQYTIEEIEEVFSVEKVVDDFFKHYKEKYLQVQEMLENNKDFKTESERCGFTSEEFTKKLLGQIVFIYFLQKKGWLGVKLVPSILSNEEYSEIYTKSDSIAQKILEKFYGNFNGGKKLKASQLEISQEQESEKLSSIFVNSKYNEKWGSGNKKFLRTIFNNCKNNNKNFFDDYLEPFFYNGLNHRRVNQYFARFNCKIPFLNGGLFEPLDNYDWEIATFNIDNSVFSNENEDGILDIFDRFNFTMNEEEPLEKEVAIDPEMLGKIFENLLEIKDRKSKGAFYTPREIVHYMCQESLANYLVNKVGVKYDEIKEFIQYGEMIRDIDSKSNNYENHLIGDSIFEKIIEIDNALKTIKVADPAVGSGAFPLGILNEIVKLRDILTSYLLIYNELEKLPQKYDNRQIINKRNIYNLKWYAIKNSIYAVDIENSAVDITKLRLWLSIVVEQDLKEHEEPQPLPNLDCKIMQGNSLIDEFAGIKLINEDLIERAKTKFNYTSKRKNPNQMELFASEDGIQIELFADEKNEIVKDLINAKNELYGANNADKKKELLKEIDTKRKELFKVNFRTCDANKLDELITIDNSHNKPYFSWKLEFIEVFVENDGFDIVIGNPPYVQLQKRINDESNIKIGDLYVNQQFKTFEKTGDLYCLFYENGIKLLRNDGILEFITSNKWMRAGYGESLRAFLSKYNPINIIDFAGTKVFDTATVDVNILTISKHENMMQSQGCTISEKCFNNLSDYIKQHSATHSFYTSDSWVMLNSIEQSIKEKIEKYGTPLSKWNVSINRGILTGYNDAFIISGEVKDKLIAEDPKSAELIRPILRGRDIKRYSYDFADLWLICIPCGFTNINTADNIDKEYWFKTSYSAIYNHLVKVENELSKKRSSKSKGLYGRDDQGEYWWELRSCIYMDDFNRHKILYSEIVQYPKFFLDKSLKYVPEATTFLMTGEHLEYLTLILNSKLMFYIFKNYYAGGGLGEKGIRYKKAFLNNLPIPKQENYEEYIKYYNELISNKTSDSLIDSIIIDDIMTKFNFNNVEKAYILDQIKGINF